MDGVKLKKNGKKFDRGLMLIFRNLFNFSGFISSLNKIFKKGAGGASANNCAPIHEETPSKNENKGRGTQKKIEKFICSLLPLSRVPYAEEGFSAAAPTDFFLEKR